MSNKIKGVAFSLTAILLSFTALAAPKRGYKGREAREEFTGKAVLWRDPVDIRSRNLYYGPGGKQHQPPTTFTFEKEDLDGSNPKFVVRDRDGVKWKIKLGQEARPETVASRLVWAAGYFENEDYFLRELQVRDMPVHVHRGGDLIARDGVIHNARLKRYLKGEEKVGTWHWRHDPFTGTRELNGLRVMMALINNWDLKDENNAIYEEETRRGPERIYMVSDLGSSFGTTGQSWTANMGKGNLNSYRHSKFISRIRPEYVDFNVPTRPALIIFFNLPLFVSEVRSRWIGRNIPRTHARWIGEVLAHLSPAQIRDAFRSAAYSPQELEGFAQVVESRIAELANL